MNLGQTIGQLSRSMFALVILAKTGGLGMKGFTLIRIINSRRRSRNAPSATFLVGRLQRNRRHRRGPILIRRRLGRVSSHSR
jgi:hypothetical protein